MKKAILFLSVIGASLLAIGQHGIGVNIKVYDPKAEFDDNVIQRPAGISFNYLYMPEESRFTYGGEIGVAMYSADDYEVDHQGQTIEVFEEDCFFTFHGFVRYELYGNRWSSLYAEGRLGATMFFSSTQASDPNIDYNNDFDVHGTAFNSGLGGGVMLNPSAIFNPDLENPSPLWINLGAAAHSGSKTTYRQFEGVNTVNVSDGKHTTLTHYMGYRLGVVFGF